MGALVARVAGETSSTFPYGDTTVLRFQPEHVAQRPRTDAGTRHDPANAGGDWRNATVDVIIPAYNEEEHIVLCLASVLRQTLRPRRIVLVDDGSSDATAARARAFCEFHGVELVVVQRRRSIGKTPTIKRQARELDSDVLFVLDADTVLESRQLHQAVGRELYQAVGIASVCGTVLPLRQRDRRVVEETPAVRAFGEAFPSHRPAAPKRGCAGSRLA